MEKKYIMSIKLVIRYIVLKNTLNDFLITNYGLLRVDIFLLQILSLITKHVSYKISPHLRSKINFCTQSFHDLILNSFQRHLDSESPTCTQSITETFQRKASAYQNIHHSESSIPP